MNDGKIKNNVKSTDLHLHLNGNLFFELKKIADKKYCTVQELIRRLCVSEVEKTNQEKP